MSAKVAWVMKPICNVPAAEYVSWRGQVADHPEPVTAERRIVGAEPDRQHLDTMRHG